MKPISNKNTFPQRLQAMLIDPILGDVMCWLPKGHSFVILRPDQLCDKVLPHYFSRDTSLKYSSFKRKLNRWGFHQIRKGPDTGAFHHPLFKRDEPALCLQMDCEKAGTSNAIKKRSNPARTEPTMPSLHFTIPNNEMNSSSILSIIHDSIASFQSQTMPFSLVGGPN
jgi:HSF-type DNA-binding